MGRSRRMAADPELCLAAYSYVADPPHHTAREVANVMNWNLRTAERYIADGRELDRQLVDGSWPIAGMPPDDAVQQLEALAARYEVPRIPDVKRLELLVQIIMLLPAILQWCILRTWALASVPKTKLESLKIADANPSWLTYGGLGRRLVINTRKRRVKRSQAIADDMLRVLPPLLKSRGWRPTFAVGPVTREIVGLYRKLATIGPSDPSFRENSEVDPAMGEDLWVALKVLAPVIQAGYPEISRWRDAP